MIPWLPITPVIVAGHFGLGDRKAAADPADGIRIGGPADRVGHGNVVELVPVKSHFAMKSSAGELPLFLAVQIIPEESIRLGPNFFACW